jgi:hypothetical protein
LPAPRIDPATLRIALKVMREHGNQFKAAEALGISRNTLQSRLEMAKARGITEDEPFIVAPLPSDREDVDALRERRRKSYIRKAKAHDARKLIPVRIGIDGPIGITHFGDPHVDDDGCNWPKLEAHVEVVRRTRGMFAGNIGDLRNNWIGRLLRLWASQSTSAADARDLAYWLLESMTWLYVAIGNHDAWSGTEDLIGSKCEELGILYEPQPRLALQFPNGRTVRLNARHDFKGRSIWNQAHGPNRAAQLGWRDHVLVCGHTHVSGHNVLKDPMSGLISHALRIASYKDIDAHAVAQGFPDSNIFCAPVTIIQPQYADDDPRLVTVIYDPEQGADYLTFLRKRKAA